MKGIEKVAITMRISNVIHPVGIAASPTHPIFDFVKKSNSAYFPRPPVLTGFVELAEIISLSFLFV